MESGAAISLPWLPIDESTPASGRLFEASAASVFVARNLRAVLEEKRPWDAALVSKAWLEQL